MPTQFTVSDAAREIERRQGVTVRPRDISRLFYERELRDDICPIVGGRRLIPPSYLHVVEQALRRRGLMRKGVGA